MFDKIFTHILICRVIASQAIQPVLEYARENQEDLPERECFPEEAAFHDNFPTDLEWLSKKKISKIFGNQRAGKSELDGLELCREGFVLNTKFSVTSLKLCVKSSCRSAFKKNSLYEMKISFDNELKKVSSRSCNCIAGKGPNGACKHIAAILYYLHYKSIGK